MERDTALVLMDVREGKVTKERARDVYRVVIDEDTWSVDQNETARLRADR